MTVTATWINGPAGTPAYDARALRLSDAIALEGNPGLAGYSKSGVKRTTTDDFKVTVTGTTINVTGGSAFINVPAFNAGGYVISSDSTIGFTATRHASQTRIGTVYLQVWDTDIDGLGQRKAEVLYDQGTPSGTPTPPTIPTLAMRIADVTVPPAGALTVASKREWLNTLGGVKYVESGNPVDNIPGQMWYQASTNRWMGSDGSNFYALLSPVPTWNNFVPANFNGDWGFNPETPSSDLQYRIERGRVYIRGRIARNNGSTTAVGTNTNIMNLPGTIIPGREAMFDVSSNTGAITRVEFVNSGTVHLYTTATGGQWFDLGSVQYDLAA